MRPERSAERCLCRPRGPWAWPERCPLAGVAHLWAREQVPSRGLEAGPGAPLGGVKGSEVSREAAQDRVTASGQAAGLQAATAAQSPGWGRGGSVQQGGDVSVPVPFLALQGCTGGGGGERKEAPAAGSWRGE